jgi:hypothetical protein
MLAVPTAFLRRPPALPDGLRERVEAVRRLAEAAHDGALDEAAGAVDVLDVLDGQDPDEDAPVQFVDQQAFVREQPEGLAQGVAGDAERAADAVLRQPCPGREVPLGYAAPEDVRDPLGGAGAPEEGPVAGEGRQLLCHAGIQAQITRTNQHGY